MLYLTANYTTDFDISTHMNKIIKASKFTTYMLLVLEFKLPGPRALGELAAIIVHGPGAAECEGGSPDIGVPALAGTGAALVHTTSMAIQDKYQNIIQRKFS